jgi:hypothetical protein
MVRSAGFEPAASGTANQRSIQLSYERTSFLSSSFGENLFAATLHEKLLLKNTNRFLVLIIEKQV